MKLSFLESPRVTHDSQSGVSLSQGLLFWNNIKTTSERWTGHRWFVRVKSKLIVYSFVFFYVFGMTCQSIYYYQYIDLTIGQLIHQSKSTLQIFKIYLGHMTFQNSKYQYLHHWVFSVILKSWTEASARIFTPSHEKPFGSSRFWRWIRC